MLLSIFRGLKMLRIAKVSIFLNDREVFMVKGIDLSWIVVSDFEAALKYYTEVLGLKIREKNDMYGWAELVGKDGRGALGIAQQNPQEQMPAGKNAVVTLTVENLEKTKLNLKKKNVKFMGDVLEIPGKVKMQTFQDVDGNMLQLVEILGE